jgi:hypothetical protein
MPLRRAGALEKMLLPPPLHLDADAARPGLVELDEHDPLPAAEGELAVSDGDGLGRAAEKHLLDVAVAVDGLVLRPAGQRLGVADLEVIVPVVGGRGHERLHEQPQVLEEARLALVDLHGAGRVLAVDRKRALADPAGFEESEAASSRLNHAYSGSPPLVSIEPDGQTTFAPADYPVLVFVQRLGEKNNYLYSFGLPGWFEAWVASHWPSNPDPFLAGGIHLLLGAIDAGASSWNAAAPLLMPLLHSELGWSETAMQAIWIALFGRDADARAIASDALIEGILDGRAHSEPLSDALLQIASCKWTKLNRLVDSLRPVGRVSPWGAMLVASVLDRLIASWQTPPRDAHHVLELQLELLMETDAALSEAARRPLQSLSGSSKTAKLAKQLLKLSAPPDRSRRRTVLVEALANRLNRVRC